jgi:hypothetical protein
MIVSQLNCSGSRNVGVANARSSRPPHTNITIRSESFHGSIGRPARAALDARYGGVEGGGIGIGIGIGIGCGAGGAEYGDPEGEYGDGPGGEGAGDGPAAYGPPAGGENGDGAAIVRAFAAALPGVPTAPPKFPCGGAAGPGANIVGAALAGVGAGGGWYGLTCVGPTAGDGGGAAGAGAGIVRAGAYGGGGGAAGPGAVVRAAPPAWLRS